MAWSANASFGFWTGRVYPCLNKTIKDLSAECEDPRAQGETMMTVLLSVLWVQCVLRPLSTASPSDAAGAAEPVATGNRRTEPEHSVTAQPPQVTLGHQGCPQGIVEEPRNIRGPVRKRM